MLPPNIVPLAIHIGTVMVNHHDVKGRKQQDSCKKSPLLMTTPPDTRSAKVTLSWCASVTLCVVLNEA